MQKLKTLFLLCATLLMGSSFAQINLDFGDDKYKPRRGQSGKDVVWIATNLDVVDKMLKIAKVGPTDLVYDLGAGDGIIAIAAAKDFGARAIGIEYSAQLAALAQRNAERAGVADRVKIIQGDIFKEDFTKATVLTLYLLPELNLQLRPTILKMKPGTRVVSNEFDMGDWEPDGVIDQPPRAFFWVVPANVAGEWSLDFNESKQNITLTLAQHFQYIGGQLTLNGKTQPLLNARLSGDQVQFSYVDQDQHLRVVHATVNGSSMKGEDKGIGTLNGFTATRR